MSSKERLWIEVQVIVAVKETTEAVADKTEKETVLRRPRTHNRSIALHTLSYQAVRGLADSEFLSSYP